MIKCNFGYYLFSNACIGIIIILLKKCFSLCAKKKGKDYKKIVHKWYKLGISGEIYDKSLYYF